MKHWFLVGLLCCFFYGCTGVNVEVYHQNIINIAWSPDQKQLAFVYSHFKEVYDNGLHVLPTHSLWLINADGSDLKEISASKNVSSIHNWSIENDLLLQRTDDFYFYNLKTKNIRIIHKKSLSSSSQNCFKDGFLVTNDNLIESENRSSSLIINTSNSKTQPVTVQNNTLTPSQTVIGSCDPNSNKVFFSNKQPAHIGLELIYGIGELNYETGELNQIQLVDKYTVTAERREILLPRGWVKPKVLLYQKWDYKNGQGLSPLLEFNAQTDVSTVNPNFIQGGTYSPDMSQVAFVDGDDLVVAKPDGSQRKVLMNYKSTLPKGDPEIVFR